jgi:hypothetical protein
MDMEKLEFYFEKFYTQFSMIVESFDFTVGSSYKSFDFKISLDTDRSLFKILIQSPHQCIMRRDGNKKFVLCDDSTYLSYDKLYLTYIEVDFSGDIVEFINTRTGVIIHQLLH